MMWSKKILWITICLCCVSTWSFVRGQKTGGSSQNSPTPVSGNTPVYGQEFTETAFGINMKFVHVEGGEFNMGFFPTNWMTDKEDESEVSHTVTLDSYYIGVFEVTQAQWMAVMGTSVSQQRNKVGNYWLPGEGPTHPMYYVSWEEASAFCQKLSQQTGKKYALPTEAQWEYAARGGKHNKRTKYSGSDRLDDVACYDTRTFGGVRTAPVGCRKPNALGIYDMSGNVSEWCQDWYAVYRPEDRHNPTGPSSGSERVLRGGSIDDSHDYFPKVYRRRSIEPGSRKSHIGFRVVLLP